ncbi:hypothetical protein SAMN04487936_101614 [Halobacillus dabanensis]|uniref:Uncharacterized protein n=2 Tax=Halobacillus dabanensis TaxID=240302 RepID=A0A1I3QAN0_HALDA|nr:hypothetical protein SAMN04487936_101614 [Halobacillus dabanensis]
MKRFGFYLAYSLGMIAFLTGALTYRKHLQEWAEMEFDVVPLMIFDHVYPVLFGMLFATSFLWRRYKEKRLKGFVWAEFLALGIPSLYIALTPWLFYTNVPMLPLMKFFATHHLNGPTMFGFIFGFTIIHSIRKKT